MHNTGRRGDLVLDEHLTNVVSVRDGKITGIDTYVSDIEMLNAFFVYLKNREMETRPLLTEPTMGAGRTSSDDKGPTREEIEYAHTNRTIAWGLVGTCIGILTFLLVIYYDVASAGEFDPLLFQLSLSVITISLFLMSFAGTYYFRVVLPIRKKDMKAAYHIGVADNLFFFGFMFLAAEPPLILLTVRLYYAATIAVTLWLVAIVLGYRIRREFRSR